MPIPTPTVARGRLGGAVSNGCDDDKIAAARVELAAANLKARIERDVAAWPELSDEHRRELAAILAPRRVRQ